MTGRPRERKKKMVVLRRPVQAVELRVRMDCEREVKKALAGMRGAQHVEVNRLQQKVAVTGLVDQLAVQRRAQSTGKKKAEPWPHQNAAAGGGGYYYAPAAVALSTASGRPTTAAGGPTRLATTTTPARSVEAAIIGADQITNLFSDDNPNACSLM